MSAEDLEKFGFDFDVIEETFDARLLSYEATLHEIAKPGVSMARFGDGELKQLFRPYNIGFQPFSEELQADLREVIAHHEPNVLIGFPPVFRNEQWATLWHDILGETVEIFRDEKIMANTAVSRPPCFSELREKAVELWKEVWDQRTVLVVTGKGSRFDLYPEFFGNATKIDFLYSSPVDAYAQMEDLLKQIDDLPRYEKYLLSLGPTATIMANRLAASGHDALDIGHLSGSYSFVVRKGVYPEKMPLTRE